MSTLWLVIDISCAGFCLVTAYINAVNREPVWMGFYLFQFFVLATHAVYSR